MNRSLSIHLESGKIASPVAGDHTEAVSPGSRNGFLGGFNRGECFFAVAKAHDAGVKGGQFVVREVARFASLVVSHACLLGKCRGMTDVSNLSASRNARFRDSAGRAGR